MKHKGDSMDKAIYDKGKVADVVVLDNVALDKTKDNPLSNYVQPAFFTIVGIDCRDYKDRSYLLRDMAGMEFNIDPEYGWWLVKLEDWYKNKQQVYSESIKRKENKIDKLNNQIEILKEILTNQGIRIVTEVQVRELGITL
jgi:hypothetical protein